ncbi:MAG TPA: hypothetical protein VD859_16510 [Nocardioides sp.]|nr:hypothetical protein [Nocardioides sp.]
MPWTRGGPLTPEHRSRLLAVGADVDAVDGLPLREVTGPLPEWWLANQNTLYLADGASLRADLVASLALYPFSDALLVLGSGTDNVASLLLGGDGATVFLGPDTELTGGDVYCGGGSAVVLNGDVTATRCAIIDARNGGSVVAERGQLWAANVYIATDDMHRLEDLGTGARLNPYGAHIRLGRHVWLGRDVVLTGHVDIGDGAVVGLRSVVRGQKVASNTAVAGVPARLVREGVAWRTEDTP